MSDARADIATGVPAPVTFEVDGVEQARYLDAAFRASGGRLIIPVYAVNVVLAMAIAAFRLGRHDPLSWLWALTAAIYIIGIILTGYGVARWRTVFKPSPVATTIIFTPTGLEIQSTRRGSRLTQRHIPFAHIRWARLTPEALFIAGRWRLIAIVPATAFADGGRGVMTYFAAHLVGRRGLRSATSLDALVVNTLAP